MHRNEQSSARKSNLRTSVMIAAAVFLLWGLAWSSQSEATARMDEGQADAPSASQSLARAAEPAPGAPAARAPAAPAAPEPSAQPEPSHTPEPEQEPEPLQRPDALSEQDQQERARERAMLMERFERQEPNPDYIPVLASAIQEHLAGRNLPVDALSSLDCKRTLCRFELVSRGKSELAPLAEVNELIATVRDLGETWVLANEVSPGRWSVEAFAPTQDHTLTGPGIE